jgi:hypothetical protein
VPSSYRGLVALNAYHVSPMRKVREAVDALLIPSMVEARDVINVAIPRVL